MPAEDMSGVWGKIFDGLKTHQEATLAAAMVFAGAGMCLAGVNPWVAIGLPVAIYLLYFGRMMYADRHAERMAEHRVTELERTVGMELQRKAARALEKRQRKNGRSE